MAILREILPHAKGAIATNTDEEIAPDSTSPTLGDLARDIDSATLSWLLRQGLGSHVALVLRRLELMDVVPQASVMRLRRALYEGAVRAELQTREMHLVLRALHDIDIDPVLLKGAALAYTLYDNPACRPKGDLDLWIQVQDRARASAAVQSVGYRSEPLAERPLALSELFGGEEKLFGKTSGLGLVELQWPPMRGEWVRHTTRIDHAAIWRRTQREEIGGVAVRVLSPEDTLVHLCLHLAVNHQFSSPWLRALVDVHMLVTKRSMDWDLIGKNVSEWRLRTTTWTVLDLAVSLLGTSVPPEFMRAIRPAPFRRFLIGRLRLDRALVNLSPLGYHFRRLVIELAMIDRVRDALVLAVRGLFPDSAWLRARYGLAESAPLFCLRLQHAWRLLTSARA